MGHSFGGKWAMFASCLFEKFACAVWSDPGIVFDESRQDINYWEPWYLGLDPATRRATRGLVTPENPRTGAYKRIFESGHDLHELHALMAPRPFLVSGGAEDTPAIEMNRDRMDKFREEMRKHYYDPSKYKTYLEQLGIQYPTVKR